MFDTDVQTTHGGAGEEEDDQLHAEDLESYDDVEVDADAEPDTKKKTRDDDDDDEDEEDDEDADEDDGGDDDAGASLCKKRSYAYHQIPESTEIQIVPAGERVTSEYMTLYEYAMVVGTRATHIEKGSSIYVDLEGLDNPRDISIKEIDENKCPLCITRKISPNQLEIWEVNEMIKPLL